MPRLIDALDCQLDFPAGVRTAMDGLQFLAQDLQQADCSIELAWMFALRWRTADGACDIEGRGRRQGNRRFDVFGKQSTVWNAHGHPRRKRSGIEQGTKSPMLVIFSGGPS
jgi:hypothetical protein